MPQSLQATSTVSGVPSSLQSIDPSPTPSPTRRKTSSAYMQPLTKSSTNGSAPNLGGNGKKDYNAEYALLLPTDRTREELENKWLKRLGRFEIWGEEMLSGYSLYSMRKWYLERKYFAHSIVSSTGKPTDQVRVYVLVPQSELSEKDAKLELDTAVQYLVKETRAHERKTDQGTILLHAASSFGPEIAPVVSGDMREAKPYMVVVTGLRRLGCGGRAVLNMDPPTSALRRKFIELYRLPTPPHSMAPLSRTNSPITSTPPRSAVTPTSPNLRSDARSDPFSAMVIETVKLIQAALAIWGLFGTERDDLELDGLFCDETKFGIQQWSYRMGLEKDEGGRLENDTSGGCIDPKKLAALLSSITSVTYELRVIGVTLPKDPFRRVKRFLAGWAEWREIADNTPELRGQVSRYVDISGIKALNKWYRVRRARLPSEWSNVPHTLVSGVAHATSSLSANLKGGAAEDGPLRRREHRPDLSSSPISGGGMGLITPDADLGGTAPPDILTTNLDAYTKGILRTKEKDWTFLGAKRIGDLWKGTLFEQEGKRGLGGLLSRKSTVRDGGTDDSSDEGGKIRGPFQAIKGLVGRKASVAEMSDSETGGGGGGVIQHLIRRKPTAVPTVIEPDVEEVDEQLDSCSQSPSPSGPQRLNIPLNSSSASNRAARSRPSINTTDISRESYQMAQVQSPSSTTVNKQPSTATVDTGRVDNSREALADPSARAYAWRERGMSTTMLRTTSDGADYAIEENGIEWEVINPHGTGKGPNSIRKDVRLRRHSLEPPETYSGMRRLPHDQLATDVEMGQLVRELRVRERELAMRAEDMKTLATSITAASRTLSTATDQRQSYLSSSLQSRITELDGRLQQALIDVHEGESVGRDASMVQHAMRTADPEAGLMASLFSRLKSHMSFIEERRDRRRAGVSVAG